MQHPIVPISVSVQRARLGALTLVTALVIAGSFACHGDAIVSLSAGERDRRVTARVGERIEVTLQTVGPGEYASPPAISSPSVAFLDVGYCGAAVPAGPTQCFHFRAVAPGRALLTFTHTGNNPPVQDTVNVR